MINLYVTVELELQQLLPTGLCSDAFQENNLIIITQHEAQATHTMHLSSLLYLI